MSIFTGVVGSIGGRPAPHFQVDSYASSVNEGTTNTVNYSFRNYETPKTLYWIINHASTNNDDFTGARSGSFVLNGTGSGSFSYTVAADHLTEGTEYFYLYIGNNPGDSDIWAVTIYINDTSTTPPFVYNDFTIEWWQKMDSSQSSPYPRLFDVGYYPTENPGISFEGSGVHVWGGGNNIQDVAGPGNIAHDTWQHWAIERHNGVLSLYSGGINVLTTNNVGTRAIKNTTDALLIGTGSGAYFQGKVTDFHWVKGYAKYQGEFSPPTAPIQSRLGTKLLLNVASDPNKFVDTTDKHTFTTSNGGGTFSSDSPYAGSSNGSIVFNGSYITTPASSDWAIDATDVVTNNLTLYLDANQPASYPGSGSTWTNLANGSANITLYGSPTYDVGPPAYINFNGTTAQYGTGSTAGVISNTAYTKIMWVNFNALAENNMVSSNTGGHYVFMASSNHIYCGHTQWGGTTINPSTGTFTTGTWYMVAVTFDTTNGMSLYINGQLDHTYTDHLDGVTGDGSVNIGCYDPGYNTLNGKMGLVLCYDRALTAQEVLDNFNGTRNRYGI